MRPPNRWVPVLSGLAALLTGLLFWAAAQPSGAKPDPHLAGQVNLPPNTSEVKFCGTCHPAGCPTTHPELVKLTWAAQGRVVLGIVGEVTCGSCHTRGFRRKSDAYLARDQKNLCGNCHNGAHALANPHTTDQKCEVCHTLTQPQFARTSLVAARALKPASDATCIHCHYDGPVSHAVGMPNTKKQARDLPLSADGKLTCVTCHIGHKPQDRFGVLLRKDNRRGGLCLSCHDDL